MLKNAKKLIFFQKYIILGIYSFFKKEDSMNYSGIGTLIKELRELLGITQSDLCRNICSQAQISKIEKGAVIPLSSTLFLICERLGISVNDFYEACKNKRVDYTKEVFKQVRKYIRARNYQEVMNIINIEKNGPAFQSNEGKQFLLWHEGICTYHLYKNKKKAIELLKEALRMSNTAQNAYSMREIEILNSIGIIYDDSGEFNKAENVLSEALEGFNKISFKGDIQVKIKLLYNLSKSLTNSKKFNKSLVQNELGESLCIENDLIYLLGEHYFQRGHNYFCKGDLDKSIKFFEKAKVIFLIQNRNEFVEIITNRIKDIYTTK